MAFRKGGKLGIDNPLFWFTEPNAWDSNTNNPNYTKPKYTLTPISTGLWELTIEIDSDWLDSAKYPVYIDPTIVLQPDATEGLDARMLAVVPNSNQGTFKWIAAYHNGSNVQNTVILFDVSSIPAGSTINSAVLYLTVVSDYSVPYDRDPHRVLAGKVINNWQESEVTWNNRLTGVVWTNPGGDYSGLYADEGGATYGDTSLETASLVQEWVNGTSSNLGYHLRDDIDWRAEGYEDSGGVYYSSDYSTASARPRLTINYTEGSGGIFIPAKLGALAGKNILNPLASGK